MDLLQKLLQQEAAILILIFVALPHLSDWQTNSFIWTYLSMKQPSIVRQYSCLKTYTRVKDKW